MEFVPAVVAQNREYGPGHWVITLEVDHELPEITPGQFLMLRCDPMDQHSLLRPFSILDIQPARRTLRVYYKHLGRLSTELSGVPVGTKLDMLYPLGTGFPWRNDWRRVALIGGGVGLAPLLFMAESLQPWGDSLHITAFFGGYSAQDLVPSLLEEYVIPSKLAAMDGSTDFHGNVVDLFLTDEERFDVVYTCGPTAMMKALQAALPPELHAYASLEERMACGVGACLGCVAPIKGNGKTEHKTVCKDGPVFDLRQVVFD